MLLKPVRTRIGIVMHKAERKFSSHACSSPAHDHIGWLKMRASEDENNRAFCVIVS